MTVSITDLEKELAEYTDISCDPLSGIQIKDVARWAVNEITKARKQGYKDGHADGFNDAMNKKTSHV